MSSPENTRVFYQPRNQIAHELSHIIAVSCDEYSAAVPRCLVSDAVKEIDRLQSIQYEHAAMLAEQDASRKRSAVNVSAIAGVVFDLSMTDDLRQALHDFGEHRRDLSCLDWSPPVWRETLASAMEAKNGVEKDVIEAIYHAIRRGWRNFYFPAEEE